MKMTNTLFADFEAIVLEKTKNFDKEKWGNQEVGLLYIVNGEGGGNWLLNVTGEGEILVENGPEQSAIMFETDVDTMKEIVYEGLEPVNAVIKGKMKVHGKKSLIFKLRNVLR